MKKNIILISILSLFGCKSMEMPILNYDRTEVKLPVSDYMVKEIIKEKDLYVIDLERSDTIFRVFSLYDGKKKANDVEIHINDSVRVGLIEPSERARKTLWEDPYVYVEAEVELFGVYISKYLRDRSYDKVRFCDDLNGPYLRSKKE